MVPMDRIVLPIGGRGQEMEVAVYTPHTYDPAKSYPLLVVLDADPLLGLLKTLNFLWVEEGKAVPVILVGLPFGATPDAIWANRSYYLLPNSVGVIDYYEARVPVNNGGGRPSSRGSSASGSCRPCSRVTASTPIEWASRGSRWGASSPRGTS